MTSMQIMLSFLPTWLVFLTACISPGPNTLIVMSVALSSGRPSALLVTLGLAIGGFIWAFISLLGVNQLLANNPQLIHWIALIGGSYLLFLGLKSLRSVILRRKQGLEVSTAVVHTETVTPLKSLPAIRRGVITTLSNPKVAMLWVSFSTLVPLNRDQLGWLSVYSLGIGLIVFLVYGTIGIVFSSPLAQLRYLKQSALINTLFSIVFITLGVAILYSIIN